MKRSVSIIQIRYVYSIWLRGEGLIPATSGLSFKVCDFESRLAVTLRACPKNLSGRCRVLSSDFSTAAELTMSLFPPQEAGRGEPQRAALVGMTRRAVAHIIPSKKKNTRMGVFFLVRVEITDLITIY